MSESLSPEQKAAVQQLFNLTVALKHRGTRHNDILKELENAGASPDLARQVLSAVNAMQIQAADSRPTQHTGYESQQDAALKMMGMGALICIIGIVVTAGSYGAVSKGGGSYIIAYGAIISGGFQFLRGLYYYTQG